MLRRRKKTVAISPLKRHYILEFTNPSVDFTPLCQDQAIEQPTVQLTPHSMGLLSILKKVKQKEKEVRLLIL